MIVLVSVLGFLSITSIVTAPSSLAPSDGIPTLGSRHLASVSPTSLNSEKMRVPVIKIGCDPEITAKETANQIRLKGKICGSKEAVIEKSVIRNSDNEEVATVFHRDSDFTTDVIHLRAGRNLLTITNFLSDGTKSSQTLVILRR